MPYMDDLNVKKSKALFEFSALFQFDSCVSLSQPSTPLTLNLYLSFFPALSAQVRHVITLNGLSVTDLFLLFRFLLTLGNKKNTLFGTRQNANLLEREREVFSGHKSPLTLYFIDSKPL